MRSRRVCTADYRTAGANPAANVVAMLLIRACVTGRGNRPCPRLQALLATLEGTESVAGQRGFQFVDPAIGKRNEAR